MEQQLSIETTPAHIAVNFDDVAKALDAELAQYQSLVVTPDNIKSAKKSATALNKFANDIDQRRKDAVSAVSGPIREFESQMKTLHGKCKDTRQGILDQAAKYEDQVRAQAENLLRARQAELWGELGVSEEFRASQLDDLVNLSAVTDAGKLTKAAREAIEYRVKEDLAFQNKVALRLSVLENESHRSGLDAPLSREHVESFLFADDDTYSTRLQSLIDAERRRQDVAEAKRQQKAAEEKAQREAAEEEIRQKAEASKAQVAQECAPAEAESVSQQLASLPPTVASEPTAAPAGCDVWRVTVVFEVTTPADKKIHAEQIKRKVSGRLDAAGIQNPAYMEVTHHAAS